MAKEVQTGPEKALQNMEGGCLVENSSKLLSDCGAVCSAEERRRRCGVLVCYLRCRGWRTVSFQSVERAGMVLTIRMRRLVCGVIYWYLWTVLIPRLRGYRLEEEGDMLQDGTSVTTLVKVKNQ